MNKYQKEIEKLLVQADEEVNKELYKAYTSSLRKIKSEVKKRMQDYESMSFLQRMELAHDYSLMLQIEEQMDILSDKQDDHIYRFLNQTGELGYNALFYEFEQTEKIRLNFTMLPKGVIETIIQTPVAGVRLSERLRDGVIKDLKNNMQSVMTSGFIKGASYQEMARSLSEAGQSSYKRALNIARTEGGRVQAVTRQKSQKDAIDMGINVKKQWIATLDGKTRDDHRVLDGQIKEVDEYFEVNGYTTLQPHMFGVAKEDCNCRCRTINVIKGYEHELRRDNEKREVIKYENYREWAGESESFERVDRYADSFGKTNMEKVVGKENYQKFLDSLDLIQDERIKPILNWAGGQLEFEEMNAKSKALGNKIQLSQKAFDGTHNNRPLQKVYHEIGHAIDHLGNDLLDEGFSYLSDSTKYQLKNSIKKDFLNLFNKDLEEIKGDNFEKIKNLKKIDIFDQSSLVRKYKKLAEENPYAYTALSDMMESTGGFIEGPLGSGHGLKYWKTSGKQEAEFFAHMTEVFVNEDLRLAMYELFPNATKAWEKMLDEILKKIK